MYKTLLGGMKSSKGSCKGIESQKIVRDFLIDNGFIVSEINNINSNGKDIVAIKNNKNYSFEVKSVIRTARSYRVNKPDINCDYIAVVMPNKIIHIESMDDWLKLCNKSGNRSITRLVNFINEIECKEIK